MIPIFPQLYPRPVWHVLAEAGWLLLPILGTLAIFLHARVTPGNHEKWALSGLFILCQAMPWALIPMNVPVGLLLWVFCLCFRHGANARRPAAAC